MNSQNLLGIAGMEAGNSDVWRHTHYFYKYSLRNVFRLRGGDLACVIPLESLKCNNISVLRLPHIPICIFQNGIFVHFILVRKNMKSELDLAQGQHHPFYVFDAQADHQFHFVSRFKTG